jgi:hypothetical protein
MAAAGAGSMFQQNLAGPVTPRRCYISIQPATSPDRNTLKISGTSILLSRRLLHLQVSLPSSEAYPDATINCIDASSTRHESESFISDNDVFSVRAKQCLPLLRAPRPPLLVRIVSSTICLNGSLRRVLRENSSEAVNNKMQRTGIHPPAKRSS